MNLIEDLKYATAAAIQRGKAEQEAKRILSLVPELCYNAAKKAQNWCDIMRVDDHSRDLNIRNLKNTPDKVLKGLLQLGFENIELVFDHDGVGQESWYNLRVKW